VAWRSWLARNSEFCIGRKHGALRLGPVVVDLQHGLVDYTDAVPSCRRFADRRDPMARAPWNMPDII